MHGRDKKHFALFIDSYRIGETPIPCVACNSDLKFGELLDMAASLGAEALATGHYVQRRVVGDGFELRRGLDAARDQSYFLFATTPAQLAKLVFPIGGLVKFDVRLLAEALGVPVAAKPDSQDICFVPKGNYAATIERLRPGAAEAGDIVHLDGRVLGRHDGIIHYTIGQRRGLGMASADPLFVIRLEADKRQVVVGPRSRLGVNRVHLRDVNWLGDAVTPSTPAERPLWVRLRSSQDLQRARLYRHSNHVSVLLEQSEHGISPGQACTFYESDKPEARVLGGGWITGATLEVGGPDEGPDQAAGVGK